MNALPDLYPAIVRSYVPATRLARVEIPGITDGGDVLPEAEFNYPMGDKSEHTEIRVLPGDRVWVSFAMGDPRFPVVMGYRNKRIGNDVDWRRWHHQNIELEADAVLHLKATRVVIDASSEVIVNTATAKVNATGSVAIDSPSVTTTGNLVVGGNVQVAGSLMVAGPVTGEGINLKNHTHPGVTPGGASTGSAQ